MHSPQTIHSLIKLQTTQNRKKERASILFLLGAKYSHITFHPTPLPVRLGPARFQDPILDLNLSVLRLSALLLKWEKIMKKVNYLPPVVLSLGLFLKSMLRHRAT